ncbi:hypothetical protein M1563_05085 [Patescibacteria group bacterium]|nr:hypothetical protein [Patescibacteria group bacterium]MCL5409424.1 hypothetical protein [Patescibacteria group bacterium]
MPYLLTGQVVSAAALSGGSLSLSDSQPSASSVSYTLNWSGVTTSAIKCVKVVFSDAASGGSAPTGMVTSGVGLSGSSDYMPTPGSWSAASAQAGTVTVTYNSGETPASASDRTIILTGITNGSSAGTTYFAQFSTYNNTDCSSSAVDSGTISYVYTSGQAVSLTVDPAISFSISSVDSGQSVNSSTTTVTTTSTTVPFSTVDDQNNAIAAQTLTVSTNAGSGYTVYARYSAAPSNGTHNITDFTGTNASPSSFSAAGTEAFGYTTESTSLSGTADRFSGGKWAKFTTSDAEVAHSAAAVSSDATKIGYQVGVSGDTPAGSYTTTVILTATPSY